MKNYRQMSMEERVAYNTDFTAWYANREQITLCIQQTGGMDDAAMKSFNEGVELVRPWPFGRTLTDSLDCLPTMRCVPLLMKLTDTIKKNIGAVATAPQQPIVDPKKPNESNGTNKPNGTNKTNKSNESNKSATPLPTSGTLHIDQIAYLLSPETKQRTEMIKAKLDERDINSNEAKRLAIEGASNDKILPYAKAASDAQEFVTKTYELVDEELAEIVATNIYIRTHKAEPGMQETAFKNALSLQDEAAKPFGSLDRLIAALTPYYNKCNVDGRIDRMVAKDFEIYGANKTNGSNESNGTNKPNGSDEYDLAEYKRIWTYVSRKDVAHTEKRLKKMRAEIDAAKSAGMPNIDAMEAIYQHEAELVLAEQQQKINNEEPSLF